MIKYQGAKIKDVLNALDGAFLNTATMKINADYLNEILIINLQNVQALYPALISSRTKPESAVWQAFCWEAAQRVASDTGHGYEKYFVSNYQLKKWLETRGAGPDIFAEAVQAVKNDRQELKAEA